MPRQTKFIPQNTPKGWRINIPKKYSQTGERERHFYPTRQAALDAAQELREKRDKHGHSAKAISAVLAEQAVSAAALLEPYGVSLLDAARRIAEIEAAKQASVKVEDALRLFKVAKEGLSKKQTDAIRQMATPLEADFRGTLLNTISAVEVQEHLRETTVAASTHNARIRVLITFWRWCGHPIRGWCDPDALKHLEQLDHTAGEIGVLNPAGAKSLLETAAKHYPECVPGYAIALFTGIRQAEIERLQPEDITKVGVDVPAAVNAKSQRRRFIEMPAPLAAWLKAYPVGETVLPANWRRKDMAVRRLAGWRVWAEMVEPHAAPEKLPPWPQNALRHTAASVALADGKPIETLIFEHGHSEGVKTLKAHYIGRMTKRDAKAILALRPAKRVA